MKDDPALTYFCRTLSTKNGPPLLALVDKVKDDEFSQLFSLLLHGIAPTLFRILLDEKMSDVTPFLTRWGLDPKTPTGDGVTLAFHQLQFPHHFGPFYAKLGAEILRPDLDGNNFWDHAFRHPTLALEVARSNLSRPKDILARFLRTKRLCCAYPNGSIRYFLEPMPDINEPLGKDPSVEGRVSPLGLALYSGATHENRLIVDFLQLMGAQLAPEERATLPQSLLDSARVTTKVRYT